MATASLRRWGVLACPVLCLTLASPALASSYTELADVIRRAVQGSEDRADAALQGLRQLRDPSLRPFFAQLAASERDDHRIQGVLGVGELEQPPSLDLFLVAQLQDPAEQAAILTTARTQGMLSDDSVADLLTRDDLPPVVEAHLRMLGTRLGAAPNEARLRTLMGNDSLLTAGRAALLLHAAGHAEEAAPTIERIVGDTSGRGAWRLAILLEDIRTAGLSACAPFARDVYDRWADMPIIRAEALLTLMAVAPDDGARLWTQSFRADDDLASRLRLALLALESHATSSDTAFVTLSRTADQPLLRAIGEAGLAMSKQGPSRTAPLLKLVQTRYAPAVAWVVDVTGSLPDDEAAQISMGIVDLASSDERLSVELMDHCVVAASRLALRNPDLYAETLLAAQSERRDARRLALLLGLLRDAHAPRPIAALESFNPPDAESRALATILLAQREGPLSEDHLDRLRRVAFGWGGLSAARRVQAAWLSIRHEGHERAAMARILTANP